MPKISIIMPCLNVKKYIEECLKSVIYQTFQDLEIIVVDAGSIDGTLDIIAHYSKIDQRIKVIHSIKKSYGYQMNIGIAAAEGEYIGIVETDDYIEPDMMEILYQKICFTDAEYIKGTAEGFWINKGRYCKAFDVIPYSWLHDENEAIVNPNQYPCLFVSDNFLWNGIYRRDFLQNIHFNETKGAAFQDIGVLFRLIYGAHKGIYINKVVYHYRQDNSGASSYNHNSLNFVRAEYETLANTIQQLTPEWRRIYYLKMVGITIDRFYFMSYGDFWYESCDSISWLKNKIKYALDRRIIGRNDFNEVLWNNLQIFMKDDYQLYVRLKQKMNMQYNNICRWFNIIKNRNIFIFGSGIIGKRFNQFLRMFQFEICGFCDNDEKKYGDVVDGTKVYPLEVILEQYPQAYFIIANKKNADDIFNQLLKVGVNPINVFKEQESICMDVYSIIQMQIRGV